MNLREDIKNALKGFGMGAANVIPGVSGGTIALLTGIYSRIINSLDAIMSVGTWKMLLRKDVKGFWKAIDGRFLLALGAGILASVWLLASLMTYVLENYHIQTLAFFFGLILASAAVLLAGIDKWRWSDAAMVAAGLAVGLLVCGRESGGSTPDGLWFIFISGAIAITTMILPGISGSYVLMLMGKYEFIMNAVTELDLVVLGVFAAGCLVGILAFAKFLHWLLAKAERQTILVLIGFVLGSLVGVWPLRGVPEGAPLHIPGAVLWAVIGIAIVAALELGSRKLSKNK